MKSSIKSYIICIIIILSFYFLLISKRIKQIKEKNILKENSIYKIKKIIPYYKTNKGFLRKLLNNENKVTIKLNGTKGQNVRVLGYFMESVATAYDFFKDNHPSQIKLNNKSIPFSNNSTQLDNDGPNTIEIIWNSSLTNLDYMFVSCEDIEWLDFSNFDFSQATTSQGLMALCPKLKYVNFGNGNLRESESLNSLFRSCSSLETVDNFFETFKVQTIESLFTGCRSLKSLDLSNLYTPFLTNLEYAFEGCTSLETIELPNLNNSRVISSFCLFENSNNLKYINLLNYVPSTNEGIKTILDQLDTSIKDNLIICTQSFNLTIVSEKITILCCNESQFLNLI